MTLFLCSCIYSLSIIVIYILTLLHSERPKLYIIYNFGLSECNRVQIPFHSINETWVSVFAREIWVPLCGNKNSKYWDRKVWANCRLRSDCSFKEQFNQCLHYLPLHLHLLDTLLYCKSKLFLLLARLNRKSYCTTDGVGIGISVGVSKMLTFYVKVFYVMG